MTEQQFEIVQHRLDAIVVLLMLGLPDEKAGKDLVLALDKGGLPTTYIAGLLGQKIGTVRKVLQRAKKD